MSQSTPSSVNKIQSDVSSNIDTLRKLKTYLDFTLTSKDDENFSKVEHVLKSLEELLSSNIDSDWHHIREDFFDLLDLCLQTILKIFDIDRSVFNRMCFKWLCLMRACVNNHRGHMLVGLGKTMLEFVLDSKQNLSPRKAMLETFILCLADCDFDIEEELCPNLQCYLVPLIKLLVNYGEYKMQCFLLEAILLLEADNTSLNRVFQLWPDVKQAFLSCTFQDFNKDCRYLLNILNDALGPKQLVFSLPCVRLYVGIEELSKPKGSSKMWVDINCGSRTISVQHLNPHSQKTCTSVLIIDHHNVAIAALEKSGSDEYVVLQVSLKKAHNGFSSTQIKILFKKSVLPLDLENILKRLFGDTFQVINNKTILKPIITSSKSSISKELENVNESKCSYKASCSTPIISPYFEGVSNNSSLNSSLQSSFVVNSKRCSSLDSFSMDKELSTSHFCENTNITIDLPKMKASISAPLYSCKKTNLFKFFHENHNDRGQTIDQTLRDIKQTKLTKTNRIDIMDDIILEPNTPLNISNLKINISNQSVYSTIGYESKPSIQQKVSNIPIKTSKTPKKKEEIENNSNVLSVCKQSENTYIIKLETSIKQRGTDNNSSMSVQENVDRSVPKDICLNPKTGSREKKSDVLCSQNDSIIMTLKSQTSVKETVNEYVLSDDIENHKTSSKVKKSDILCPQNDSVMTLKSQTSVKGNELKYVSSDDNENPKISARVNKKDVLCPQNDSVTTLNSQTSVKGNELKYVLSDDNKHPKISSRVKKSDILCPQNDSVIMTLKSKTSVKGNEHKYVSSDDNENPKIRARVNKRDVLCPQNCSVETIQTQTLAKGNVNEYVLSDDIENPKTSSRVKKSDALCPQNGGVITLKSHTSAKGNVNEFVLSDDSENPKTNSRVKKSDILCPRNDSVTTLKSQISAKVNEQKNILLYDIETDKASSIMKKSNIQCPQNGTVMIIQSQTLAKGNENNNVSSNDMDTPKSSKQPIKSFNENCLTEMVSGTLFLNEQECTVETAKEVTPNKGMLAQSKKSKRELRNNYPPQSSLSLSSKATTKNIPNLPRLSKLAIVRENKLSSKIKTNKENQTNLETKSFPKKNVGIKEHLKLRMTLRSARKSHSIPNGELEPINVFVNSLNENFPKSDSCSLSSDDYIDATPGIDINPKFKNRNKGKENVSRDSKNNLKPLDKKHNLFNPKQLQKYEKNNVLKNTSESLLSNGNQHPILKPKCLSSHNVINNKVIENIKSVSNKIMVQSSKFEEESTKKLVITSPPHQTGSKLVISSETSNPLPSNDKKNTEEAPNSRNCTDFKEQINLNQIQNKDFTSIISAASIGLEVCPVSDKSNNFNIQRNITNLKNSSELKQNGKSKLIDLTTTATINECLKNTPCPETSVIVLNKSRENANYIFSNNKSQEENQKCPHRITKKIKTSKQCDEFNASLQVKNNLISDHLELNAKPSNFIEKNVHNKNNSSKLEFTKSKKIVTKRKLKDTNSKENIQNIFHSVDRNVGKIFSKNQGNINNMSITSPIKIVSKNYVDQMMSNNVTNISETPCIDNNVNVPRKKRKLFSKTPDNELIMTSNNLPSEQHGIHFDYDLEKTSRDLTMLKNNIPSFAKLSRKLKKKQTRSKKKNELNNIYSKDIGDTTTSKIKMVYSSNKTRKNKTQNKRYKPNRKNEAFWPSPNKFRKASYEIEINKAEQNTCRPPPNANRWKEKFITDVKKKSKIKLKRDRQSAYTSIFSEVESDDSLWQKNISQDSFSNSLFYNTFTSKNKKKPRREINNCKKNSKFECGPCDSTSENENLPPLIVEVVKPKWKSFFTRSRTEERHLTNDASVKPLDNITNNLNTLLELPINVADASLFNKTNNDMSPLLNRSRAHDGTHNFHSDSENPLQKNISQKRVHPVLDEQGINLCKESDTVKPNMFLTSPIRNDHRGNFKINQLKCNNINLKNSHIHNIIPRLCSQETVIVTENISNKQNCSDLSRNEKSSNECEVGKILYDNDLEISKTSKISSNMIKKGSKEECINSFTKHLITNPKENMQFQEMNLNLIEARDDHNEAGKIISPNSNSNKITPMLIKNNGEKTMKYICSEHQYTKMKNNDTNEKTYQKELYAQGAQKLNEQSITKKIIPYNNEISFKYDTVLQGSTSKNKDKYTYISETTNQMSIDSNPKSSKQMFTDLRNGKERKSNQFTNKYILNETKTNSLSLKTYNAVNIQADNTKQIFNGNSKIVEFELINKTLGKDANKYFQKMNDKMSFDSFESKLDKNSCQEKTNGEFPSETNSYISKDTVASNFAAKRSDGPNFSQPILLQVENDQETHAENKVQKKSDKIFSSMNNEVIDVDAFLLEMGCTQNSTHCGIEKLCSSQTNKVHSPQCTENNFVSLSSNSMSNNSVNTFPIEMLPLCNNNNRSSNIHQPETISANFDLDDNSLKSFDDLLTPKVDNALKKHNKSVNKMEETILNKETTVIENTSKFKCSSQLSTDSKEKHESKYSKIIRKENIHTAAYDPIVKLSCEQNSMIRTLIQNAENESHRFHNHKEGYPTSEEHNTYNGIPSLSCLQSTQEMLENHVQKRSKYLSEFQAKVMRKLQSCFSDTYERNQKQRFAVVNRYLIEIENEMQVMEAHQTQLKTFEQQLTRLREYITKIISSQSISSKNASHSLSEMRELHRKLCDELDKLESSHKNDLDTDMKSAREKSVDVMRQFWANERKQAFLKMNLAIQAILLC